MTKFAGNCEFGHIYWKKYIQYIVSSINKIICQSDESAKLKFVVMNKNLQSIVIYITVLKFCWKWYKVKWKNRWLEGLKPITKDRIITKLNNSEKNTERQRKSGGGWVIPSFYNHFETLWSRGSSVIGINRGLIRNLGIHPWKI